jgi:hypothetical protein
VPRPKKFYDELGRARVTLKKGNDRQPGGARPHAQYVQADGRRVNKSGMPVKRTTTFAFPEIHWDVDDDNAEDLGELGDELADDERAGAAALAEEDLAFDEVAEFALKSPALHQALQTLDAAGFALLQGPANEGDQLIVAAGRILVDPALTAAHTLTSVVAREAARAAFIEPKVSPRGRDRLEFSQANAAISTREEGLAVLFAEQVRSEILGAGGPDVGVPGASGAALALCEAVREGRASRLEAAAEIGRTALVPTTSDAFAWYAELWGRVYDLVYPASGDRGGAVR